jgi:hypothetical protein
MRAFLTLHVVAVSVFLASLQGCRTSPMSKQEATDWYARYGSMVRWVGYQGSDEQFHHFIARVMDDWNFIQIRRDELKLNDEKPFSRGSSAPLYYYLVDPSRDYQKIGEPDAAANPSQPGHSETSQQSVAAGSGR